jgi:hypothetical protein
MDQSSMRISLMKKGGKKSHGTIPLKHFLISWAIFNSPLYFHFAGTERGKNEIFFRYPGFTVLTIFLWCKYSKS